MILLLFMVYLHVKKPDGSSMEIVESTDVKKEKQSGSVTKSTSDTTLKMQEMTGKTATKESISKEIIPKREALQKDGKLNLPRIKERIGGDIKQPNIKDKFHSTFGRKVVYIYFSHNRESFLPYFQKGTIPEMAYHSNFNITLVGERLGKTLKHYGIGNTVSNVDIINMLHERNLNFNHSYQMSRELVLKEKKFNRDLEMYFDIHRDALPRKYTTIRIKGKSYAKISFVVGSAHKNYKENLEFTNAINGLIEKNYPGLSRGVIVKSRNQGNGVYNQDLSPNSVIIEIGGVENRIEELYRTADALGSVISEYYWDNVH